MKKLKQITSMLLLLMILASNSLVAYASDYSAGYIHTILDLENNRFIVKSFTDEQGSVNKLGFTKIGEFSDFYHSEELNSSPYKVKTYNQNLNMPSNHEKDMTDILPSEFTDFDHLFEQGYFDFDSNNQYFGTNREHTSFNMKGESVATANGNYNIKGIPLNPRADYVLTKEDESALNITAGSLQRGLDGLQNYIFKKVELTDESFREFIEEYIVIDPTQSFNYIEVNDVIFTIYSPQADSGEWEFRNEVKGEYYQYIAEGYYDTLNDFSKPSYKKYVSLARLYPLGYTSKEPHDKGRVFSIQSEMIQAAAMHVTKGINANTYIDIVNDGFIDKTIKNPSIGVIGNSANALMNFSNESANVEDAYDVEYFESVKTFVMYFRAIQILIFYVAIAVFAIQLVVSKNMTNKMLLGEEFIKKIIFIVMFMVFYNMAMTGGIKLATFFNGLSTEQALMNTTFFSFGDASSQLFLAIVMGVFGVIGFLCKWLLILKIIDIFKIILNPTVSVLKDSFLGIIGYAVYPSIVIGIIGTFLQFAYPSFIMKVILVALLSGFAILMVAELLNIPIFQLLGFMKGTTSMGLKAAGASSFGIGTAISKSADMLEKNQSETKIPNPIANTTENALGADTSPIFSQAMKDTMNIEKSAMKNTVANQDLQGLINDVTRRNRGTSSSEENSEMNDLGISGGLNNNKDIKKDMAKNAGLTGLKAASNLFKGAGKTSTAVGNLVQGRTASAKQNFKEAIGHTGSALRNTGDGFVNHQAIKSHENFMSSGEGLLDQKVRTDNSIASWHDSEVLSRNGMEIETGNNNTLNYRVTEPYLLSEDDKKHYDHIKSLSSTQDGLDQLKAVGISEVGYEDGQLSFTASRNFKNLHGVSSINKENKFGRDSVKSVKGGAYHQAKSSFMPNVGFAKFAGDKLNSLQKEYEYEIPKADIGKSKDHSFSTADFNSDKVKNMLKATIDVTPEAYMKQLTDEYYNKKSS